MSSTIFATLASGYAVIPFRPTVIDENTMVSVLRLAVIALLLSACGLKGPLTLPNHDKTSQQERSK